jgi:hypothetical protein
MSTIIIHRTRTPDPCPSCMTQVDPVTIEICPKCRFEYPQRKPEFTHADWVYIGTFILIAIVLLVTAVRSL